MDVRFGSMLTFGAKSEQPIGLVKLELKIRESIQNTEPSKVLSSLPVLLITVFSTLCFTSFQAAR